MRQLEVVTLPEPARSAAIALGAAMPLLTPAAAVEALADTPPERLVAFWYQQRVLRLAIHRIREVDHVLSPRLLMAGAERIGETDRRIRSLRQIWTTLGDICDQHGLAITGIKGMTMEPRYDGIGPRDLGDVDVMAHTADDAWRLVGWLRQHGWQYLAHELPWLKRTPAGHLYGQAILHDEQGARVDIHFGGYSIRHNAWVPSPAGRRAGLSVAGLDENFAYLLGNAAGDYVVRLKEINDLSVYLGAKDFDWPAARSMIVDLCLEGFWNALIDAADQTLNLRAAPRQLLRGMRIPHVRAESPAFGVPQLAERRRATVRHARRYHRRSSGRWGLRAALSASLYYRMPLRMTVLGIPGLPSRHLTRRLTNDRCVRLLPVSAAVAEAAPANVCGATLDGSVELRRVRVGAREYFSGAGDLFLPTVFFLVSRGVLREAGALVANQTVASTR